MGGSTLTPATLIVERDGLDALIGELRAQHRTVLGPLVRDGVITHGEVTGIDDLPIGWTEQQSGGTYRLQPTGTDEIFAFSTPSESWKRYVHPPRALMLRARREGPAITVETPRPEPEPVAFFGVRSCDLAALGILDRVLLDPEATDPNYAVRRSDIFIVAAGCSTPAATCFCASMQTGPSPTSGFDLSIAELKGSEPLSYLIAAGTERGAEVLGLLPGRSATAADHEHATAVHDQAVAAMHRTLDAADPPRAAAAPEHPQWNDIAERCLACGNCTMVCPTCFCSSVEDTTSLDGNHTDRTRVWDSCFGLDFTHMHGGPTRTSIASRYRHWLLHKLVTWQDQFDSSGCVGCGRCITWCPVGIDLTAEIPKLARAATEVAP
ncbi:MAG: 4Fe-4S dicluster domain-containing protein [Acidimicrobiales bacterium]|nr:4Fe-4S dicluster domain-containing protein [Acidimicrobiales bacterium]